MKTIFSLLFLFSVNCFAQTKTTQAKPVTKPATTDCPTWNKPSTSKAGQFEAMRHKPVKLDANGNPVIKPKKKVTHTPSFDSGSDKVMEKKKTSAEKKVTAESK